MFVANVLVAPGEKDEDLISLSHASCRPQRDEERCFVPLHGTQDDILFNCLPYFRPPRRAKGCGSGMPWPKREKPRCGEAR